MTLREFLELNEIDPEKVIDGKIGRMRAIKADKNENIFIDAGIESEVTGSRLIIRIEVVM